MKRLEYQCRHVRIGENKLNNKKETHQQWSRWAAKQTHQGRGSTGRKIIHTWKPVKTGTSLQQTTLDPQGQTVKRPQKTATSLNPSDGVFMLTHVSATGKKNGFIKFYLNKPTTPGIIMSWTLENTFVICMKKSKQAAILYWECTHLLKPSGLRWRQSKCRIKNHLLHLMGVVCLPLPSPSNMPVFMSDSCLHLRHKLCLKAINFVQASINILLNGSGDIHQDFTWEN